MSGECLRPWRRSGVQTYQSNIADENIIPVAGVNSAMRFSGDLRARLHGQGSVSDFEAYLSTRLQTCFYPISCKNVSNDKDAIITGIRPKILRAQKILNLAAQLSFFCSASTYAYFIGWGRFLRRITRRCDL